MKPQIKRIYDNLTPLLIDGKVTVIYGPRQVGKTTLVKNYLSKYSQKSILQTTGEDIATINALSSQSVEAIKDFAGTYQYIFIDEAQSIPQVGLGLKLLIDTLPDRKIIATGSSSFDLTYKLGEPLTGRQNKLVLYPISAAELVKTYNKTTVRNDLDDYLTYGMYPEIRTTDGRDNKILSLKTLVESYLLRDIWQFAEVKNTLAIRRLLIALAYQIGSLVSLNELASTVQIDVKTVQRYLDLLAQSFVIYPLGGYSRNLRSEMVQKHKYYFYDVGVRNALIGDFNSPMVRGDIGGLFENFIVMERVKARSYGKLFYANDYFWRNSAEQEIDLVEDYDGILHGYEIKWSPTAKVKKPAGFLDSYTGSTIEAINRENWLDNVAITPR